MKTKYIVLTIQYRSADDGTVWNNSGRILISIKSVDDLAKKLTVLESFFALVGGEVQYDFEIKS